MWQKNSRINMNLLNYLLLGFWCVIRNSFHKLKFIRQLTETWKTDNYFPVSLLATSWQNCWSNLHENSTTLVSLNKKVSVKLWKLSASGLRIVTPDPDRISLGGGLRSCLCFYVFLICADDVSADVSLSCSVL